MVLESIAVWEEKELFFDKATENRNLGAVAVFSGCVDGGSSDIQHISSDETLVRSAVDAFGFLKAFLQSEYGEKLFCSLADMERTCQAHLRDHVFYPFRRECWGFRVLDDAFAWYIACTPWNTTKQYAVYCYDRAQLMNTLAKRRGLSESCYAVLLFSGERIRVRFGESGYESFPQYGKNMEDNLAFAKEQNKMLKVSDQQMAAMEGGAVYGWESPLADIHNYDKEGHYVPPIYFDTKEEKRK